MISSGRITHLAVRALDAASRLLPARAAAPHIATGQSGEEAAYFHLRRLGYTIVARNFRSPRRRGEIDLIGWEGGELCFIEVKTRSQRGLTPAETAVDAEKQQELRAMAREYLRRLRGPAHARFDVVSVYMEPGMAPEIGIFKNAFTVS